MSSTNFPAPNAFDLILPLKLVLINPAKGFLDFLVQSWLFLFLCTHWVYAYLCEMFMMISLSLVREFLERKNLGLPKVRFDHFRKILNSNLLYEFQYWEKYILMLLFFINMMKFQFMCLYSHLFYDQLTFFVYLFLLP